METINKVTSTVTSHLPKGKGHHNKAQSKNPFTGEVINEY